MREVLISPDRATWLKARERDLTSTDAASLCGVGRRTRYQLFQEKVLGNVVAFEETEAMRLGKALEAPIAEHIAREHGMEIDPLKDYMRIPDLRLGSSFDYVARDRSYLLEIKLVGPMQFRQGWRETDWGLEAPIDLEAQIQQEMLVAEIPLAFFGVLVGTETHLLRREFDQAVADRLKAEAAAFWSSPCPEPDWQIDADFVIALNRQATPGKVIDADDELTQLLAEYEEYARQRRVADDNCDAAKAKILSRIGDAEKVTSEIGSLSCGMTAAKDIAYHREAFRNFRFFPKRSK